MDISIFTFTKNLGSLKCSSSGATCVGMNGYRNPYTKKVDPRFVVFFNTNNPDDTRLVPKDDVKMLFADIKNGTEESPLKIQQVDEDKYSMYYKSPDPDVCESWKSPLFFDGQEIEEFKTGVMGDRFDLDNLKAKKKLINVHPKFNKKKVSAVSS